MKSHFIRIFSCLLLSAALHGAYAGVADSYELLTPEGRQCMWQPKRGLKIATRMGTWVRQDDDSYDCRPNLSGPNYKIDPYSTRAFTGMPCTVRCKNDTSQEGKLFDGSWQYRGMLMCIPKEEVPCLKHDHSDTKRSE